MDAPPVQYVTTPDCYNIAYTRCGEGQSLLLFPVLFSSVETIWHHYPELVAGLAARFHLVCFDARGEGMSTRGLAEDKMMKDFDLDTEAVAGRMGTEPMVLFALGSRGHHAIRYAAAHPERVKAIVWNGASLRNDAWPASMWIGLSNENWRLFLAEIAPRDIPRDEQRSRIQDYESCVKPEDWAIRSRVIRPSDISKEVRSIRVPILVTHARDYLGLPLEESMNLVAAASNARLVVVEGDSAVGDTTSILTAVDSFLADLPSVNSGGRHISEAVEPRLSIREVQVLRLLAEGKSNPEIAKALFITRNTVQNHVSSILIKTNLGNRTEAALYAREHGLI